MATLQSPVVITDDPAAVGSMAHHHNFPEIRAEGRSPADAAARLITKLERTLESALSAWRRDEIEQAIADVGAYVKDSA